MAIKTTIDSSPLCLLTSPHPPLHPQIMRIVGNIRPDRQTVMFSATFPRSVETLARQVLRDPVEIQVCSYYCSMFVI